MTPEPNIMREGERTYRMLQVGERIQVGDQWKYRVSKRWSDFLPSVYKEGPYITEPSANRAFPQGYYRRPVAADPDQIPDIPDETLDAIEGAQ